MKLRAIITIILKPHAPQRCWLPSGQITESLLTVMDRNTSPYIVSCKVVYQRDSTVRQHL